LRLQPRQQHIRIRPDTTGANQQREDYE